MNIVETQGGFAISFPFDYNKVKEIKQIPGAWFNSRDKTWTIPRRSVDHIEKLKRKYGLVDETIVKAPEDYNMVPQLPELDVELPLIKEPFAFQRTGIAYCRKHPRTIIGDQPGLGKTLQSIGAVCSYGLNAGRLTLGPGLVICPASLKLNWQKEWKEVAGINAMVLGDRVKNTWHQYNKVGMVDVFICNYESLKKFFVAQGWKKPKDGQFKLKDIPFRETINLFKWIIIDESHKCKDGQTQQAKFVMGITKGKEHVYELTGTPVVNKPKDLIPQLIIIDKLKDVVSHLPLPTDRYGKPTDFSGYKRFINRYCGGGNDATNLKELNYRLNLNCFYRREKSEVLKDLPAKMRQVILCDITNRTEYEKAETQFVDYLKNVRGCTDAEVRKKLRGDVMVKMGILKQISARGKIEAAREHIDEIIEGGKKIVVFCSLREIGDQLRHIYPRAVMIRGGMSMEEKDASVRAFQNDPKINVAICSIKAAGVGLTLTASSDVLFIEFPWTDADCEQCEDRTHRIGQYNSVLAAYLLGDNKIDRYCYYDIILKKRGIARAVTGAQEEVHEEIVDELLNLFNQK
jgi:SWI/SNF-related matrix-associated actin-dependent regulator 1 of chromatin subfamily A